jgi:Uma2 family endonuclease
MGMNVQTAIQRPDRVKLKARDFMLLKDAGAFAAFEKSELLEGELWGVPRGREEEPDYDSSFPIKLRIPDYEMLEREGAFEGYRKTELIDGVVYAMSPQYRPHMRIKSELAYRLRQALEHLGSTLFIGIEGTVSMPPYGAPEPDILLTSEPEGEGPVPVATVALLIEVADTTAEFDRTELGRFYAGHGVPEYWVVNVKARVIDQMWAPEADAYARQREVKFGERLEAATIGGLGVETAGIN